VASVLPAELSLPIFKSTHHTAGVDAASLWPAIKEDRIKGNRRSFLIKV